eukprot:gene2016-3914_t
MKCIQLVQIITIFAEINATVKFGSFSAGLNVGEVQRHLKDTTPTEMADKPRSRDFILPRDRPNKSVGELIEFELFDNKVTTGIVNSVIDRGKRSATWLGSLLVNKTSVSPTDWFTLSCHDDACSGNLMLESINKRYVIKPSLSTSVQMDGVVVYCISEAHHAHQSGVMDHPWVINRPNKLTKSGGDSSSVPSYKLTQESNMATNVDRDLIIDIGVMYTPQALVDMGNSAAAMQSLVNLATDEGNQILTRSLVNLRLRVVFTFPLLNTSFVEPGNPKSCSGSTFSTLLSWFQNNGDGIMDEAHTYRDTFGADFVLLINHCGAYGGMGYVNIGTPGNSPSYAFANYNVGYVYGLVWMHELGHIMGCFHDRFSDVSSTISYPTYSAYGHCWEDTNKNDCTCYRSVMAYAGCVTSPNSCTNCPTRDILSNFNVIDPIANAATGTVLASCGVHIDTYGYMPITYRKSIQTGGIIYTVSPSSMLISECGVVNITGWMIGFASNITSVTLSGVSAAILSQSIHWVVVRSPNVTTASVRAGDVIVTTDSGRVSTLRSAFRYTSMTSSDLSDFSSGSLSNTVWSSTGKVTWSTSTYDGHYIVKKNSGNADGDGAELSSTNLQKASLADSCYDTLIGMSFSYWAYSDYSFCYNGFSVSTMNATSTGVWKKVWTGKTYSTSLANRPWNNITLTLPADTRQVKFNLETSTTYACRWWTPLKLDKIILTKVSYCPGQSKCLFPSQGAPVVPDPTSTPSRSPTAVPTVRPSTPTSDTTSTPTRSPTSVPTVRPSTPTSGPTSTPTRSPTTVPTVRPSTPTSGPTSTPTRSPTAVPTVRPSTPTSGPTSTPTRSPTAVPTVRPSTPTSGPTSTPTRSPTTVPTVRPSTPTSMPTFQPSRPSLNPTLSPSAIPTITPNISSIVLTVSGLSSFDGSTQFQYYGPLKRGLSSKFTISVWIRTTTASGVIVNYGRSPSNFNGEMILQITSAGKLQFWDYNSGYGFNYVTGNSVVTTGQLIHVAFVKNGVNGEFFINGVSDGKVAASKSVTYSNTAFCIGKDYRDNNGYFKGTVGEVRVYDTALILPQIQSLASTPSPSASPTVGGM